MHSTARDQTNRMIAKGLILKKTRCDRCAGLRPEVNHLDYSRPDKVNFLCRRCHMLYHEYRDDGVPGSQPALPDSVIRAYRRYRRVKAFWLYWFWLPIRFIYRRIWPVPDEIKVNHYRQGDAFERILAHHRWEQRRLKTR